MNRLAPDPSAAKAGRSLSDKGKWSLLARNDAAIWGECKGSAAEPYRTEVELSEPAFKCSCPSRKFPCKHALGLLLIFASDKSALAVETPPPWVAEWLEKRGQQAEKKARKTVETEAEELTPEKLARREAGKTKRSQDRAAKVAAGVAELELWLRDLVRNGLAAAKTQPFKMWDGMAARMVDAQAPGIARRLAQCGEIIAGGEGWADVLTSELGRLYLLVQAYKRIDSLPEPLKADVRSAIGWTVKEEEILQQPGVRDEWQVAGQRVYEEDRLQIQRTWLLGINSRNIALILNFAFHGQQLDPGLAPGTCIEAELVYYPASHPTRAAVKERFGAPKSMDQIACGTSSKEMVDRYSDALCLNPWLEVMPASLSAVVPILKDQKWYLIDRDGSLLRISAGFRGRWPLMALAGGNPVPVFGEWDGRTFMPLGTFTEGRFVDLAVYK